MQRAFDTLPRPPRKLRIWLRCAALALTATLTGLSPAHGQTIRPGETQSDLPTVDRDRTDRTTPQLPRGDATRLPGSTTSVAIPTVNTAAIATTLTAIRYEGASLPGPYLAKATASFIGKPINAEQLTALAATVGTAYSKSDIAYYSVMIPAQTPTGGILTIRVVEGAVTHYTINGAVDPQTTPRMAAQIRHIMRDTPLRKSVLERTISLMRDLPGQSVEASIRQLDLNGALVIDLTSSRKKANIAVTIDNNGVANVINTFQAQVAVSANNLIRDGDQTRVSTYLPIHPDRYQYYSISHSTPLGDNGLLFTASGAHLRTRTFDRTIAGRATLAGGTLSYPIIRSSTTNLIATASLDGIDSTNYFLNTEFGDSRSRAIRLGLNWSKSDAKNGYAVSVVASQGLAALGARAFVGFSEKRFTKVNLQAVIVRTVAKNLTLRVTTRAQYSGDLLPVTERATIGGPGAGRAFTIGAITGEKAVTGMGEIAWSLPAKSKLLKTVSLFAFVDGAVAGTIARPYYGLPAENFSLASAGGGIRATVTRTLQASVEVAVPVKRPASYYGRSARVFFGLSRSF
jgi:hemolysin activation/secretion protein